MMFVCQVELSTATEPGSVQTAKQSTQKCWQNIYQLSFAFAAIWHGTYLKKAISKLTMMMYCTKR